MKQKVFLSNYHYLFLIAFFILHAQNEYFGLISFLEFFQLTLALLFSSTVLFWILKWLFKCSSDKAGIITSFFLSLFLFFGVIQDALSANPALSFLSELTKLCFVLFILSVLFISCIKIFGVNKKLINYVNLVLIVLILVEFSIGFKNMVSHPDFKSEIAGEKVLQPNTIKYPVYVLVLDAYAGDKTLQQFYNYDNSEFNIAMSKLGFYKAADSKSNYLSTVHSVASFLNMNYIPEKISKSNGADPYGYKTAISFIYKNKVAQKFYSSGYEIKNYSFFDFQMAPASFTNDFWGGNIRLVTSQMIYRRVLKNLPFFLSKYKFSFAKGLLEQKYLNQIKTSLNESLMFGKKHPAKPVFTYIHLNLPHPPYLFDSTGNEFDHTKTINWTNSMHNKAYIWNLQAANKFALSWVDTLQKIYKQKVVIIVMSDHGSYPFGFKNITRRQFDNLNMIYWPTADSTGYVPGLTNVNQFRVVFNKLFGQEYPLLLDSFHYSNSAPSGFNQ